MNNGSMDQLTVWQAAVLQAKPGSDQERHAIRGCAEAAANNESVMRWLRAHPAFVAAADEFTWQAQRKTLEAAVERDDGSPGAYADVSPEVLTPLLVLAAGKNRTEAAFALLKAGASAHDGGCAALLAAVDGDHLPMVKLLLAAVVQAARAGALSAAEYWDVMARARTASLPLNTYAVYGVLNAAPMLASAAAPPAAPPQPKRAAAATTKDAKKAKCDVAVSDATVAEVKHVLRATNTGAGMASSVVRRVLVDVLQDNGIMVRSDGYAKDAAERERADNYVERIVYKAFGVRPVSASRGTGRIFALSPHTAASKRADAAATADNSIASDSDTE